MIQQRSYLGRDQLCAAFAQVTVVDVKRISVSDDCAHLFVAQCGLGQNHRGLSGCCGSKKLERRLHVAKIGRGVDPIGKLRPEEGAQG